MARLQVPDLFVGLVEYGLDHRAFRGGHDYFVVAVVERRTDAAGVAHDERVAVPDHTGHHVAAVPATGCQRDDLFQVDMLGQQVGNLLLGVSLFYL